MGRSKGFKTKKFEIAIDKADYDAIVNFAIQNRSKKHPFSFCDELENLNEDELRKLMKQLLKLLMDYMEMNLDQTAAVDWTTLNPEHCRKIGQFIQAATDISMACLLLALIPVCRVELVQIAVFLDGLMPSMPKSMDYVKNGIVHYCEKLFTDGVTENCELFLTNVVMHLVRKTAKRSVKTDVKRISSMKAVLEHIVKQNGPNATQLWSILSESAVSHLYMSMPDAPKVVGFVMTLNTDKFLEIHEKVKNYIPGIPLKSANAYGQLYFEAWCCTITTGDKEIRDIIEITCLQEFLHMALQSKHKNILPIIRKIFIPFFINKKNPNVSKMLYGVYQPLIWRYLKHPNGLYRAAAAQLFLDIFPLEDPDMRVVRNDIEVTEQLLMIKDLLIDDFPIVRITAVLGICVSMSVNWEVFPEEMLKTFFRIIVNDLSRDSATAEVRLAVVKGIKCLLENPLTIRSLSSVLPKLTGLFHDISENVRIAFCQLLLRVKKISAIKYFQIVPINHLFARMEEDCHAVKKSLSSLLFNSYFPRDQDPKVWLGRCLEIIKTEKTVSRVFFSYVSGLVGINEAVRFMIQAVKAVHFYVKTKSASSHIDMEISDKENIRSFTDYITTLEQAVGFGNLNIVKTLMESIAVMWLSLKPASDLNLMNQPDDKNKKIIKMLVGKLSLTLSELCLYYKDTEAWEPVFYLSSFLPFSHNPSLSSLCFMRIKNLPPDAQESDYLTLLECLANQFQMCELLNILKEWIETGLSSSYVPPPAKKRRGRKKTGEGVNHDQSKPYLANRMLNTMLNHRNLQKHALVEQSALLEILYFSDIVKRKLEKVNARLMSEVEADFLNLLVYNIIRISVLLHNHPTYDLTTSVPFLNEFVEWTNEKLVKHLSHVEDKNDHFTLLIFQICENLCKVLSDVTAIGFFEPDDCLYLNFIYTLLDTDFGYRFLLIASRFMYKHAASSQLMILVENSPIMMQNHLVYLTKVFVLITSKAMLEKISEKEVAEVTFTLGSVMQIVHNHIVSLRELTSELFKIIIKNILDFTAVKCSDTVNEMAEDPFDRLSFPTNANFFISIINLKPKLIRIYVKYLTDVFKDSEDIDISHWIAYCMIIWSFLHIKPISQHVIKEIYSLVLLLEKHINNLFPRETDDEENNLQDHDPLQLFQNHCHSELIKLKKWIKPKLRVSKSIPN